MRIFLIGFMGSGKTTVGKALAKKLNVSFTDLDRYIEEENHKSISEIFTEKGEEGFRELESVALREIIAKDSTIISCGGGTPCFNNNIELMNKSGLTVYLQYPAGKLKNRLLPNMRKRPLLKNLKTAEELDEYIRFKLIEREKHYLKSKLVLKNPAGTKEIIDQVTAFLQEQ